jgi:hypothetical protein
MLVLVPLRVILAANIAGMAAVTTESKPDVAGKKVSCHAPG